MKMNRMEKIGYAMCFTMMILLLLTVTLCGVFSLNTTHSYEFINQYGTSIKIWGSGIYAHDSYFKAPIFIGSDLTVLILLLPLLIVNIVSLMKQQTPESYVSCLGVTGTLLYYSASLTFGVTYNILHLAYITLFGLCFFISGTLFLKLHLVEAKNDEVCSYSFTKGMKVFLFTVGIALFAAWLPDIITSYMNGKSLELIEVYTTEITYVIDMGIVSPLMIITFFLMVRKRFIGYVFMRIILQICICVGIMLPMQTLFQALAGLAIPPIPALVTKVFIFVILAILAAIFQRKLKQSIVYFDEITE